MRIPWQIKKANLNLETRYGPPDSDELLAEIANLDLTNLQARADHLTQYPLSHNARDQRIGFLSHLGQKETAKESVAIGMALYPESIVMIKLFLNLYREELQEGEAARIKARFKALPGHEDLPI